MEAEETALQDRLKAVKKEIGKLGEVRPGRLSEQWNVCGQAQCACKDPVTPRKHGPYWVLSWAHKGKGSSEFVHVEDLERIRRQVDDYRRLRELRDEWVDICLELARLRRARRKAAR